MSSPPHHWNSSLDAFDVEASKGCTHIFQLPFLSPYASLPFMSSSMFFGYWPIIASFGIRPTLYFSTIYGEEALSVWNLCNRLSSHSNFSQTVESHKVVDACN